MAKHRCGKLHVVALGLATGIIFGLGAISLAWGAALSGWGIPMLFSLSTVYIGYAPTFLGGLLGGLWAFADGFITASVLALLYNYFSSIDCHSSCSDSSC